ncbi:hypothetical protein PHJA_001882300 [Phtheirospermum japonicum]|uniref:Uncharacterized protein n=1 Tax=Phtheirospermum japonicum TaxID=374723 RepID=A0A830CGH3_9LAMI|nr:hypothetical protein PHJA_001882300 [Phtheirospermum japonicum]
MSNDATALSLIRQSLSSAIPAKINDAETAKDAWDELYGMCDQAYKQTKESSSEFENKSSDDKSEERTTMRDASYGDII